jgi:hypothetical protein
MQHANRVGQNGIPIHARKINAREAANDEKENRCLSVAVFAPER